MANQGAKKQGVKLTPCCKNHCAQLPRVPLPFLFPLQQLLHIRPLALGFHHIICPKLALCHYSLNSIIHTLRRIFMFLQ